MKEYYFDFPKVKVPEFLTGWNHNGLYFMQANPCSYKYIGDGYMINVFVGSETDPSEFEVSIISNDGNVGATCTASTAEEAEQFVKALETYPHKERITEQNILAIAKGEMK